VAFEAATSSVTVAQLPAAQATGHERPHAPQWTVLVCPLTQPPSHAMSPPSHTQAPALHTAPSGHVTPQAPQFTRSVAVLTQTSAHTVGAAVGQAHAPPEHAAPRGHTRPHAPQLSGSDSASRHAPPQRWKPALQVKSQAPATHAGRPFEGAAVQERQLAPHAVTLSSAAHAAPQRW